MATEVSDSTLRFDREQKVPSYRRGGVPEVWVVNLPEGQVEVTDELGLRVYEPGCGWGLAIESAEVHLEALFEDLEVEER